MTERFGKAYRISGVEAASALFQSGRFMSSAGLNLRVHMADHPEGKVQFLISVPKRKLRHAVDRNRVRRQIREGLRKNKSKIEEYAKAQKLCIRIGLVYQENKVKATREVEQDTIRALEKVLNRLEKQRKR